MPLPRAELPGTPGQPVIVNGAYLLKTGMLLHPCMMRDINSPHLALSTDANIRELISNVATKIVMEN